jgi:hypothetical protein
MGTVKAKLLRSYRKEGGKLVFVYGVSGATKDVEAYVKAQGTNLRRDEKTQQPLFFTPRGFGESGKLIVTDEGRVFPDMSAFDMAASLASQYGGNLGDQIAKSLLGTAIAGEQAPEREAVEEEDDTI